MVLVGLARVVPKAVRMTNVPLILRKLMLVAGLQIEFGIDLVLKVMIVMMMVAVFLQEEGVGSHAEVNICQENVIWQVHTDMAHLSKLQPVSDYVILLKLMKKKIVHKIQIVDLVNKV